MSHPYKSTPFAHQLVGTAAIVENDSFFIADEMGAGKSKQVVDAACILAEQGKIDTVIVVVPASVRCVWMDAEIGEIKKHAWRRSEVYEFHSKLKQIWKDEGRDEKDSGWRMKWIITNYEFLRNEDRLTTLCAYIVADRVLLVLDESSYIKSRTAKQTKAIAKLRKHCVRCVMLNGTPITNSPLDLWSQMQILDKRILGKAFKDNFYFFRSEYCDIVNQKFGSGPGFKKVVGYKRLDDLANKVAPYVLRRLKKDCLDLPPKLYTEREVPLSAKTWKLYQELKKDFVMSLGPNDVRLEPNAAVRLMRLAQLTSGILGGSDMPVIPPHSERISGDRFMIQTPDRCLDLSDEKLKWAVEYLTEECTAKAVIVWTRWRRERERLVSALLNNKNGILIYQLYGGQSRGERESAITAFSNPLNEKMVLLAQPHAGGHGLNLVAASEAIYLSNDFALGIRLQSEDRCHRPGQVNPVTYIDVLATGPQGERTIDHIIFRALRDKKSLADITTDQWRKELDDV